MEKFVIEGGVPLSGTIVPAGNKNGALPILAACLLTDDEVILRNVPRISDVEAMVLLLRDARRAGRVARARRGRRSTPRRSTAPTSIRELAERIRASFLLAGPLLARFGRAHMPPPGGDVIGRRRLDPAPRRVPRARRRGRAPTRDIVLDGAAARPAPVRLPDGRAVGDGDRERADGRRPDPRTDRDPQRRLRAARPGPGADAGRDGRRDRRDRLQRDDRPRHRPACAAAPTRSRPTTSRSARSWRWPASPAAS